MRLSVPGNILLLGEYAVLEEGGIGLAVAVDRRVVVTGRPAAAFEVHGAWPGGSFRWTPAEPGASGLVTSVVGTLEAEAALADPALADPGALRVRIDIDSSAFFDASGRKTGLGSSAAAAAGLTAALLAAAGGAPPGPAAAELAVRAHRGAQGGRGSGYDVLCSWHGGAGVFRGGETPVWEPRVFGERRRLFLYPGPQPVKTLTAVMRYAAWKKGNAGAARTFLEESNERVLAFLSAATAGESAARWSACRELGIQLGDAIGVPARMSPPPGLDPAWCKPVGAGNELGVCLVPEEAAAPAGVSAFSISPEGIRWEG